MNREDDTDVVVTGGSSGRMAGGYDEYDVDLLAIIRFIGEASAGYSAPIPDVLELAAFFGYSRDVADQTLTDLFRTGMVYEPTSGRVVVT